MDYGKSPRELLLREASKHTIYCVPHLMETTTIIQQNLQQVGLTNTLGDLNTQLWVRMDLVNYAALCVGLGRWDIVGACNAGTIIADVLEYFDDTPPRRRTEDQLITRIQHAIKDLHEEAGDPEMFSWLLYDILKSAWELYCRTWERANP